MLSLSNILKDKKVLAAYNLINLMQVNGWAKHGLDHIKRVIKNAYNLYDMLQLPTDDLQECLIACALHDTGNIFGKINHAQNSAQFAELYLANKDISTEQIQTIINAIANHENANLNESIMHNVLVLADKLDTTNKRILPAGLEVLGMRQTNYILDIALAVNKNVLQTKIIITDNFDILEWENFFFTQKLYNAINVLAKQINKTPEVNYTDLKGKFTIIGKLPPLAPEINK